MLRKFLPLAAILAMAVAAIYVVWPSQPREFLPSFVPWPSGQGIAIGDFERREMRLGLDLQGGTRLLLRADVPETFDGDLDSALEGTVRVLRRRVDGTGVTEAQITRQGEANISVQLPGLTPEEARSLLGRTAQLRFCEPVPTGGVATSEPCDPSGQWQLSTGQVGGQTLGLTGQYLRSNAYVGFDQLSNPFVGFEFTGDGGRIFEQVTSRRIGQQIAIFLDAELLSAPVVNAVISDSGTITGLNLERARELVVQLNAGALPLELTVLQEQAVDATLGADSVRKSVLAGQIGLMLVALFMILYYRLPGLIAAGTLIIYAALTLAAFKLVPVTLTLAGIGAFVLSVGMAVDANILIFERLKEELRAGRSYAASIDAGFARAWPSIRDSNVTTLITCLILFVLGGGIEIPILGAFDAPLVQGFAVTLAVGVMISMFTAIMVTRTFMRALIGTRISRNREWFVDTPSESAAPTQGAAS
ncbi:MAG: protein translocase subunit SecD [Chloroflexi bacterium]|nr:protein translocase subunit SecD [Chloroflexota bacterium]